MKGELNQLETPEIGEAPTKGLAAFTGEHPAQFVQGVLYPVEAEFKFMPVNPTPWCIPLKGTLQDKGLAYWALRARLFQF
jgi:hypothetical protein